MRPALCLTVPGLHGSGADHWQTWAEREIPNCRRVQGIDFEQPVVAAWADAIRQDIRQVPGDVILLAHSFGCLASVLAVADHDTKVSAVVLVAPASPKRFGPSGLLEQGKGSSLVPSAHVDLTACLPLTPLPIPGVLLGSENDPWMTSEDASHWAHIWGLKWVSLGNAGHVNTASGYGRWPAVARLVELLRERLTPFPLGEFGEQGERLSKNRFSALTKARRLTREILI